MFFPYLCQNGNIRPQEGKVSIRHTAWVTHCERVKQSFKLATQKYSEDLLLETQIIWKEMDRLNWNDFFCYNNLCKYICMQQHINTFVHTPKLGKEFEACFSLMLLISRKRNEPVISAVALSAQIRSSFHPPFPSSCLKYLVLSFQYPDH